MYWQQPEYGDSNGSDIEIKKIKKKRITRKKQPKKKKRIGTKQKTKH